LRRRALEKRSMKVTAPVRVSRQPVRRAWRRCQAKIARRMMPSTRVVSAARALALDRVRVRARRSHPIVDVTSRPPEDVLAAIVTAARAR